MRRRQHRKYRRAVDAWVDEEVHGAAAQSMARHLRDCWDCSSAAETARLIKGSLRRLPDLRPRPLATARIHRYAERLARP